MSGKFSVANKFVGTSSAKKSRKQTSAARDALANKRKLAAVEQTQTESIFTAFVESSGDAQPSTSTSDLFAGNNGNCPTEHSASASKLRRFHDFGDAAVENHRSWVIIDCGQLNQLLSEVTCPTCTEGQLRIEIGERGTSMGLSQKMIISCTQCNFTKNNFSSPRINNLDSRKNVGFEVNKQAVLYTHEIGEGFASLQKFCTLFGMPCMNRKTFYRLDKQVNSAILESTNAILDKTVVEVKRVYRELFPEGRPAEDDNEEENDWEEEDGIPWIDVSFDGTWHKRGFTSHHGIGVVIDVLTGYVIDMETCSTYCHVCEMNKEKLEGMTEDEQQAWKLQHEQDCEINHDGSAKSMEREAALRLWRRSVERHSLRYRTMLSDGDSVAFNAVEADAPYGNSRPVTKLECVNHVHKRMGSALRKKAKEARLGGRGQGRLTADKCTRLQNYYRGAILDNLGNEEAMTNAIWASLFHVTSTDADPHHTRCPDGTESWCFFKKALAERRQPPSHVEHNGTALSREVFRELVPIYKRMSSPALLKRVMHGKTQNANESLHHLIWLHCPKEIFFGKHRLEAAVAEAVSKFNRGQNQLAEVLQHLHLSVSNLTLAALDAADDTRVKKAAKATAAVAVTERRRRRVDRQHDIAHQEDQEGQVYGGGMLEGN